MADKIRYGQEQMMGDLMLMVKKQYFNKAQIQDILKQRENHEYRLKRANLTPLEYLESIEYEYTLERERKKRVKELDVKKETGSDYQIIKRIIRLYDRMCGRFKYQVDLWMDYLRFAYSIKSKKYFQKAVETCLRFN